MSKDPNHLGTDVQFVLETEHYKLVATLPPFPNATRTYAIVNKTFNVVEADNNSLPACIDAITKMERGLAQAWKRWEVEESRLPKNNLRVISTPRGNGKKKRAPTN